MGLLWCLISWDRGREGAHDIINCAKVSNNLFTGRKDGSGKRMQNPQGEHGWKKGKEQEMPDIVVIKVKLSIRGTVDWIVLEDQDYNRPAIGVKLLAAETLTN